MVIDTGLLSSGLRSEFFSLLKTIKTFHERLCMPVQSSKPIENYRWLGHVPQMREWGEGRVVKGLRAETYDIANQKYEITMEVDEDELEDDQTGQINLRLQELTKRAGTHKDFLLAALIALGGSTLCYDGQFFFDTDHVSGASGTQSNALTYDAAVAAKPTVAEFKSAFDQAITALLAYKDDVGEPANQQATGLIALVPPSMFLVAKEALSATIIGNTDNVIMGMAEPVMFPWLSAPEDWFLAKVDDPVKPFVNQMRRGLRFTALNQANDFPVFMNGKLLFGADARYRVAYGEWTKIVRTRFT